MLKVDAFTVDNVDVCSIYLTVHLGIEGTASEKKLQGVSLGTAK